MSLALPAVTGREVLKALVSIGFVHVSTEGSHAKVVHPDGRTAVVVPMHGGRDIPRGTLGSILRQAGLTVAEFARWVPASGGCVIVFPLKIFRPWLIFTTQVPPRNRSPKCSASG